jgi:hypothetical protein
MSPAADWEIHTETKSFPTAAANLTGAVFRKSNCRQSINWRSKAIVTLVSSFGRFQCAALASLAGSVMQLRREGGRSIRK